MSLTASLSKRPMASWPSPCLGCQPGPGPAQVARFAIGPELPGGPNAASTALSQRTRQATCSTSQSMYRVGRMVHPRHRRRQRCPYRRCSINAAPSCALRRPKRCAVPSAGLGAMGRCAMGQYTMNDGPIHDGPILDEPVRNGQGAPGTLNAGRTSAFALGRRRGDDATT